MDMTSITNLDLEDEGYTFICYVRGKGICAIYEFLFTTAIVYGIDSTGYRGRYCYPKQNRNVAVLTLGMWLGKESIGEAVEEDPEDPYWVKHKGGKGDYANPNYINK